MNVTKLLIDNSEVNYKLFSQKLIPDTKYKILGVRVPKIKKIAKDMLKVKDVCFEFLNEKHEYFEEYFLHGIILGNLKSDYNHVINLLNDFLPSVDNWAICDSTVSAMKIFKNNRADAFKQINVWLKSKNAYTIRFAIVSLLQYFIDDEYIDRAISLAQSVLSEHYYTNMAVSWFFSVALVKQYDKTIEIFRQKNLPLFIHNKSIQKAIESFRISDDKKQYLKTLKK